jgi:hypothetical protein
LKLQIFLTNISKNFEITNFPGKFFRVEVFHQNRVLFLNTDFPGKLTVNITPPQNVKRTPEGRGVVEGV